VVSQKCQYGLRAVFELARQYGRGPVKIGEIASRQAIPSRFLEVILGQLKRAGFVASQRGQNGGYCLVHAPGNLTIGEIVRFFEGPIGPVRCVTGDGNERCPLHGECVFLPIWEKAGNAMADVYDSATLDDLVEADQRRKMRHVPTYSI